MQNRIKELRKALKLTLEEFGKRICASNSTVSRWEQGGRNIPDSKLRLICEEFNVSPVWLETGAGEMFTKSKTRQTLEYEAFERVALKIYSELSPDLQAVVDNIARKITSGRAGESIERYTELVLR